MAVPTGWKAMREAILTVMREDLDGGREGEVWTTTIQFAIERRYGGLGPQDGGLDWDDRSLIGKAFERALRDLRETGDLIYDNVWGYMLPGVSSSRFRDPTVAQGIARLEEQAGPEVASLAAQFLLHSAAEREGILERRVEHLEREVEVWREKAQTSDRRLFNARQRLLAIFEDDDNDYPAL